MFLIRKKNKIPLFITSWNFDNIKFCMQKKWFLKNVVLKAQYLELLKYICMWMWSSKIDYDIIIGLQTYVWLGLTTIETHSIR